jgi:hypothetical protein
MIFFLFFILVRLGFWFKSGTLLPGFCLLLLACIVLCAVSLANEKERV